MLTIQQQLKEARTKANLSLSQMGELIKTDRANIAAYESGRHPNPTHELLKKWANTTGYTFTIQPDKSENNQ